MAAVHAAELELRCASPELAGVVLGAVAAELAAGPEGSRTRARAEGAALRVEVEAPDLSSLRAALQGAVRLADAAHRVAAS